MAHVSVAMRRRGEGRQPGERRSRRRRRRARSERTSRCVSERAEAPTHASAASAPGECGGEGGIRTRDGLPRTAFPVRRHSPLGDLSPRQQSRNRPCGAGRSDQANEWCLAERAGFEPTVLSHTAFRERHHQPLGHLSAGEDTKDRRMATGRGPGLGRATVGEPGRRRGSGGRSCGEERFGLVAADAAHDLDAPRQGRVLGQLDDRARPPRRGCSAWRRRAPRRRSRAAPRRTSRTARGS